MISPVFRSVICEGIIIFLTGLIYIVQFRTVGGQGQKKINSKCISHFVHFVVHSTLKLFQISPEETDSIMHFPVSKFFGTAKCVSFLIRLIHLSVCRKTGQSIVNSSSMIACLHSVLIKG